MVRRKEGNWIDGIQLVIIMREVLRNWKVLLLIVLVLISLFLVAFNGLQYGIDFQGGTHFLVHLDEELGAEDMDKTVTTITNRLNWAGLKDTKIVPLGTDKISATISETDPDEIKKLESELLKQGKFEAMLNGELLFSGSDIVEIEKSNIYISDTRWSIPFKLKPQAAKNFSDSVFHQCVKISSGYECKKTFFFIDRPSDAVVLIPEGIYQREQTIAEPDVVYAEPPTYQLEELFKEANVPYIVVDSNSNNVLSFLDNHTDKRSVVIPEGEITVSEDLVKAIEDKGFRIKKTKDFVSAFEANSIESNEPWIWRVLGVKTVINLTEGVTNMTVPESQKGTIQPQTYLSIEGGGGSLEDSKERVQFLQIILESGNLPAGVESISKESVPAFLGSEFLATSAMIGLVALVLVTLVVFIRYRVLSLILPMLFTGLSEVLLILGFAVIAGWNLDLAAVAGIVAAVGTGVDDQIIIADELLSGAVEEATSLFNRIKRAFFMIFAAASTTLAAMLPIIMFGTGMGKLVGFALVTSVGILFGVFITRPAFSEIAKYMINQEKAKKAADAKGE